MATSTANPSDTASRPRQISRQADGLTPVGLASGGLAPGGLAPEGVPAPDVTHAQTHARTDAQSRGQGAVPGQSGVVGQSGVPGQQRLYPVLVVLKGEQTDARFVVNLPVLWIGREEGCAIRLTDVRASRKHAALLYENFGQIGAVPICRIRDNGSTNGTRVNGELIEERILVDRDSVTVGRTLLGFSLWNELELDAESRLLQNASTDDLTGLHNRRSFDALFALEFSRARQNSRPLSVLMVDVDHFKRINDAHGHAAGDAVLRSLARIASAQARAVDAICRYGGEEFVIVAPDTGREGAMILAERLRAAIERSPVEHESQTIRLTASIGVASLQWEDTAAQDILRRADAALYRAKQAGRNRVVLA